MKDLPPGETLLTKGNVATRWQASTRFIDRQVRLGKLAKIVLGPRCTRFRLTDIEAAEKQHRTKTVLEGLLGVKN